MWVPLKAGRHRSQLRTMPHFARKGNLDEFIGTFLPVTTNSNKPRLVFFNPSLSFTSPPPRRKKNVFWGCVFLESGEKLQLNCEACGQALRTRKHRNVQNKFEFSLLLFKFLLISQLLYKHKDTYRTRIHKKCREIHFYVLCTEYFTKLIETRTEPIRSKPVCAGCY